jgi:hypothetical protein
MPSSRQSFDNTYHHGGFRGNVVEMLRRGYDVHLHYANFGIRKFMIRLPYGLSESKALWSKRDRKIAEMQEWIDREHRHEVRKAQSGPPPQTVLAYQAVHGHFPRGWPPVA